MEHHHGPSRTVRRRRRDTAGPSVADSARLTAQRSTGAAVAQLRRIRSSRAIQRAIRLRVGAAVAVLLVAGATQCRWDRAEAVRRAWGQTSHVLVSTRPLAVGDPVDARSVEVRAAPVDLVPSDPLREVAPGQRATRPIGAGRILVADDVADRSTGPTAAGLTPGRAGVVVPIGPGVVAVGVGDRVDVVRSGASGAGSVVTTDARVLAVTDVAVTLSVDDSSSAAVAGLALGEPLGLVVREPAGPP